tara:strand:- start:385 stop:552 length:168 start_codon:yes stop_codon:yes gene_type:complete
MKEVIKIHVRVEIEYNENDPSSRKEAIEKARDNVTGIKTYGYPISIKPLTSKLIK